MTRAFQVAGYDRKGQELFAIAVDAIGPDDAKLVTFRELRTTPGGSAQANAAEKLVAKPMNGRTRGSQIGQADRMTTDPKFQPLVDDLKNWLELEHQKESMKAAGLNSAMDAFRPTADYLEQLGKELENNVDHTISIGQIGRWNEGPDQKFSARYEVKFKGHVCHALNFTVQGRQIRIDDHVFVVGDQTALEETLGRTIVEAIKRESSRR